MSATEQLRFTEKWMGDAIGRWEGDTLVVETKHFNTWHRLRGYGVENLTVTERFRRSGDNKHLRFYGR